MSHKYLVLSGGTSGKELPCQCRRCKRYRFHPWVRKIPWRRHGNTLQYSCLENPMDRGAWRATVHRVAKSQTWLSDFTFNFHFHALEKEMATHSSVLAWRIPGTEEPGGLPPMGLHRVRYHWSDLAAAAYELESDWHWNSQGQYYSQEDNEVIISKHWKKSTLYSTSN